MDMRLSIIFRYKFPRALLSLWSAIFYLWQLRQNFLQFQIKIQYFPMAMLKIKYFLSELWYLRWLNYFILVVEDICFLSLLIVVNYVTKLFSFLVGFPEQINTNVFNHCNIPLVLHFLVELMTVHYHFVISIIIFMMCSLV